MPISTSLESVLRRMVWDRFRPGTDLRGGTAIGTLHSSPSAATAILNCTNRDDNLCTLIKARNSLHTINVCSTCTHCVVHTHNTHTYIVVVIYGCTELSKL